MAQYEPGVLEACMNLLQVSPQHQKNSRRDYLERNNPVYVGRVVSAMVGHVFTPKYTEREKVLCVQLVYAVTVSYVHDMHLLRLELAHSES